MFLYRRIMCQHKMIIVFSLSTVHSIKKRRRSWEKEKLSTQESMPSKAENKKRKFVSFARSENGIEIFIFNETSTFHWNRLDALHNAYEWGKTSICYLKNPSKLNWPFCALNLFGSYWAISSLARAGFAYG